jgi:hypothetical protein
MKFSPAFTSSRVELAALPDLYLIHPINRAFMNGESTQLETLTQPNGLQLIVVLGLLLAAFVVFDEVDTNNSLIPVFLIPLMVSVVLRSRHHQRLRQHGHLLKGTLIEYTQLEHLGEAGGFEITVRFFFDNPSGHTIRSVEKGHVDGIPGIPQPEAPLAVLYLTDDDYLLL